MRVLLPITMMLMFWGTTATAQAGQAPATPTPLRIVIPIVAPDCDAPPPSEGVIVVCGRKEDRYRIDPTVLAAIRRRDSHGGPRPDAHTTLFADGCSGIGLSRCAGQNVVPVSSILFVAVTALIKVVKGEDLRPMLHTVPDEYALYKDAKAIAQAKDSPTGK